MPDFKLNVFGSLFFNVLMVVVYVQKWAVSNNHKKRQPILHSWSLSTTAVLNVRVLTTNFVLNLYLSPATYKSIDTTKSIYKYLFLMNLMYMYTMALLIWTTTHQFEPHG